MHASSRRRKVLAATSQMVRLAVSAADLVEPLPYGGFYRNNLLDLVVMLVDLRKQLGGSPRELDLDARVLIELGERWPR
jgi:hypothetical protein